MSGDQIIFYTTFSFYIVKQPSKLRNKTTVNVNKLTEIKKKEKGFEVKKICLKMLFETEIDSHIYIVTTYALSRSTTG